MNATSDSCENCNHSPLVPFINEPDHVAMRCPDCRLYQKGVLPRQGAYEEDYHDCYEKRRKWKIVTATIRIGSISNYLRTDHPRSLDIGCSIGATVEASDNLGWDARGVDLSQAAIDYCGRRGLNCYKSDGVHLPFPDNYFDVITSWHVIEHVENIHSTLHEWNRVLKPGGLMIIEAPDGDYLKARLMGARYKKFWQPMHLYTFNYGNLSSLLGANGFDVLPTRLIGGITTLKPSYTAYALAYRGLRRACRVVKMCKSFEITCRKTKQSGQMNQTRAA